MPHASEANAEARPGEVPLQFGKYRLSRLLARGGMGEVYLARLVGELGFEKHLVIKTILPELAAKKRFIELFAAEAKTAVALSHGNIVPTYELGRTNDTFYIVMGYVDGPSVAQMLAACKQAGSKPDLAVAMHIIRGVLAGLAYAHHEEPGRPAVVHRDITPRNILLDRSGQVRIVDFGIAAPAKAEGGVRAGSTGFVAPEQVRGDVPDPRADVFSAAALLYELCTHTRAFPKPGVWVMPDLDILPEPLRAPLAAALSFEPDDRPRNATALLARLRPAILEYAGHYDDQALAAYLRALFPEGSSPSTPDRSGVSPIVGFEGENQTFATRLTSVTGAQGSGENALASEAEGADVDPDRTGSRPVGWGSGVSPARAPEGRRIPFAPLLLGAAAIVALALAMLGDDEAPAAELAVAADRTGGAPEPEARSAQRRDDSPTADEGTPAADPDREHASFPVTDAPPQPDEAPTTADPTTLQPPEPAPRVHELAVDPPDAEVLVNGRPASTRSPHPIALPHDGALVVEVRKPGYEPRRLELDASSTPPAKIVLAKAKPKDPGFLRVTAPNVPWAEVRLDGRRIGTTPTRRLVVSSGRHRIKVRCIPDACAEEKVLLEKPITIEPNQLLELETRR